MKKKKQTRKLKKWIKNVIVAIIILSILDIIVISYTSQKKEQTKKIDTKNKDEVTDICKKIDYCNKSYYNRYKTYYKKNKNHNSVIMQYIDHKWMQFLQCRDYMGTGRRYFCL